MKKSLIGFSDNVYKNKEKIKVWAKSFKKHCSDNILLIVANPTPDDIQVCDELNILYNIVEELDTHTINHKRLIHTYNALLNYEADLVLVTDVFDVVFQNDPFKKIENDTHDIFLTGEGVLVKEEPWNCDVINKVFPEYLPICKDEEVICSGVIAGKKNAILNLYKNMYDLCESGTNEHNIKDQAALIVLKAKNELQNFKFFTLNDAWAMHCATSGPTQFFEGWGFKTIIENRYNIPTIIDNQICTALGTPFDIVHQFNRIPEWHTIIKNKYLNVL